MKKASVSKINFFVFMSQVLQIYKHLKFMGIEHYFFPRTMLRKFFSFVILTRSRRNEKLSKTKCFQLWNLDGRCFCHLFENFSTEIQLEFVKNIKVLSEINVLYFCNRSARFQKPYDGYFHYNSEEPRWGKGRLLLFQDLDEVKG